MATRLEDRPLAGRTPEQRSLGSLIGDLAHETTTLLRKEVELAKVEMTEKIEKFQTAVTSMAAAGAVLYAGAMVFLFFLVAAVDTVLDNWIDTTWLAPLIVSAVLLAVGYFMFKAGKSRLDSDTLVPKRTLRSLQRDASFVQHDDAVTAAGTARMRPEAEEIR